jgi:hypothetical protein
MRRVRLASRFWLCSRFPVSRFLLRAKGRHAGVGGAKADSDDRDGKLMVYYTDQRDVKHAQKIVHQTTTGDFDSWGPVVDDVTSQSYADRPGAATVAKLPNGRYIQTFVYSLLNNSTNKNTFPVYYKIASSLEGFAKEPARKLDVNTRAQPNGSPFVTWTPLGGVNGTIVVSTSDSNSVFINQALTEGSWKEVGTPAGRAYSREVRIRKYLYSSRAKLDEAANMRQRTMTARS